MFADETAKTFVHQDSTTHVMKENLFSKLIGSQIFYLKLIHPKQNMLR